MKPLSCYLNLCLSLSLLFSCSSAFACRCAPISVAERYEKNKFVFVGLVESETPVSSTISIPNSTGTLMREGISYQVKVERIFKGELPKVVNVSASPDGMCGGSALMLQQRYVFFQDDTTDMGVNLCAPALAAFDSEILVDALVNRNQSFESIGWNVFDLLSHEHAVVIGSVRDITQITEIQVLLALKPSIIFFWKKDCDQCLKVAAMLRELKRHPLGKDLFFVSIYTQSKVQSSSFDEVQNEYTKLNLPWSGLVDPDSLLSPLFKLKTAPAVYYVPKGQRKTFEISSELGSVESLIEELKGVLTQPSESKAR